MLRTIKYYTCDQCKGTAEDPRDWMAVRLLSPSPREGEASNMGIEQMKAEHHFCSLSCLAAHLATVVAVPWRWWRDRPPMVQPAEGGVTDGN